MTLIYNTEDGNPVQGLAPGYITQLTVPRLMSVEHNQQWEAGRRSELRPDRFPFNQPKAPAKGSLCRFGGHAGNQSASISVTSSTSKDELKRIVRVCLQGQSSSSLRLIGF